MRRLPDETFEFRRPDGRVIPRCGYRLVDAVPDQAILESFEYTSAEAWLAALLARGSPVRSSGLKRCVPDRGGDMT